MAYYYLSILNPLFCTTMESEIVILSDEELLKFKASAGEPDERSRIKIDEMLKCVCFTDNGSMFQKYVHNGTVVRPHTQGSRHKSNHSHPRYFRHKSLNYHDKVTRELFALLNKASLSNQKVIQEKMIKLVDPNTVELITKMVLDKCVTQFSYLHIFVNMLDAIKQLFPTQLQQAADTFIQEHLSGFPACITSLSEGAPKVEDYNAFCSYIKAKSRLISANSVAVTFCIKGISTLHVNDYFDQLLRLYHDATWNDESCDVLLKLMYNLFIITKEPNAQARFIDFITETNRIDLFTPKTKFIMYDILDLYHGKPKNR